MGVSETKDLPVPGISIAAAKTHRSRLILSLDYLVLVSPRTNASANKTKRTTERTPKRSWGRGKVCEFTVAESFAGGEKGFKYRKRAGNRP